MSQLYVRQSCPACASTESVTLYSLPFAESPLREYVGPKLLPLLGDGVFQLEECRSCGLIFQREAPDERLAAEVYEVPIDPLEAYRHDTALITVENLRTLALEILRVIAYLRRPPHELTFLDFGMGWGRWGRIATALGCRCYGVEIASEKARVAEGAAATSRTTTCRHTSWSADWIIKA